MCDRRALKIYCYVVTTHPTQWRGPSTGSWL